MSNNKATQYINELTTPVIAENNTAGAQAKAALLTLGRLAKLKSISMASSTVGIVKDSGDIMADLSVGAIETARGLTHRAKSVVKECRQEGQQASIEEYVEMAKSLDVVFRAIKDKTQSMLPSKTAARAKPVTAKAKTV